MKPIYTYLFLAVLAFGLASCGKGYEVRFANYYTEEMDSVIIGNNKLVITSVKPGQTTNFYKISKGHYTFTCISKSKKRFSSEFFIPSQGSGKRTIQIDGIQQISVLEE